MMEIGSDSGQSGNYSSIYRYQLGFSNAGASYGGHFIIQSLATSGSSYAVAGPTVTHFSIDGLNKLIKIPGSLNIGHFSFDNSNITGAFDGITNQNYKSGQYYKMSHTTGNSAGYLLADYGFLGESWNMTFNAHTNNGSWVIPHTSMGGSSRYLLGPGYVSWYFGSVAGHPSTLTASMNGAGLDVNGQINCKALLINGSPFNASGSGSFSTLSLKSGRQISGYGTLNQIEFEIFSGGLKHFITTRHDSPDPQLGSRVVGNAIDFWLNEGSTASASSSTGTGNVNALSVTAKGIGIFSNAPQDPLDVNGRIGCTELTVKNGRQISGHAEKNQIAFQYYLGGYRHFITTRHDARVGVVTGNAIDFWLNTSPNSNDSSSAGTGNTNTLSISAVGVGIFTNSPNFPLDVMSAASGAFSLVNYYLYETGVKGGYSNTWLSVSIHASGTIWAEQVVIVSSDERIKKNISSSTDSLEIVNKLNLRSFEYIDVRARLERHVQHGLIAQEVEKVYPEAVTKTTGFIPSIYTPGLSYTAIDLSSVLITIDKPHELIEGDCVRVYINTDGKDDTPDFEHNTLVLRTPSNTSFVIAPWEAFELGRDILVYGKKVNDLMGINNPLIGVLAAGACQTLSKKNESLKEEVETLKAQVASLQVQLNSLNSYVTSLLLKYPL